MATIRNPIHFGRVPHAEKFFTCQRSNDVVIEWPVDGGQTGFEFSSHRPVGSLFHRSVFAEIDASSSHQLLFGNVVFMLHGIHLRTHIRPDVVGERSRSCGVHIRLEGRCRVALHLAKLRQLVY